MSYANVFEKNYKQIVSVDRSGALTITGVVEAIDEQGVTIKVMSAPGNTQFTYTYIEFTNICGITTTDGNWM